ncbi:pilus assembly FimT family protein [Rosistilla oblonga]|uniref:pilus assembly FimT family protein n=1 Tax=Rosistilla oblonga TaxID=2527990 RepID=UPI003A97C04C
MSQLHEQRRNFRIGFTLVELLIVVSIITLVTAIALPTVRDQLRDQKATRTASLVRSYLDTARARAVNTGKPYGVVIKRSGTSGFESARSIELRYCRLASSYSGDESDAFALITPPGTYDASIRIVQFPNTNGGNPVYGNDVIRTPPPGFVVVGDTIQFDDSDVNFQIRQVTYDTSTPPNLVSLLIEPVDPSVVSDVAVGAGSSATRGYSISRFRETASLPLYLQTGTMIDLAFSGYRRGDASVKDYGTPFGSHQRLAACQFSPMEIEHQYDLARGATSTAAYDTAGTSPVVASARTYPYGDIYILFAPNGTVYSVIYGELYGAPGSKAIRMQHHLVNSDIYLMVGREGLTDVADPMSLSSKEQATAFDLQSVWVVINGVSGEVTTQTPNPIASVRDSGLQAAEKTPAEMHNGISALMHVSREKI